MTEVEWGACTDPRVMLDFLQGGGKLSGRKARLFAAAVCRRLWPLLTDGRARTAVEVAERFADGLAGQRELSAASAAAEAAHAGTALAENAIWHAVRSALWLDLGSAAHHAAFAACCAGQGRPAEQRRFGPLHAAMSSELAAQCGLLRDLTGNPFRPPPCLPPSLLRWDGGTLPRLARGAYADRDPRTGHLGPDRLAVLADALEDAGCTDTELLAHLRGAGPHVRGCWVIDLLLGKS